MNRQWCLMCDQRWSTGSTSRCVQGTCSLLVTVREDDAAVSILKEYVDVELTPTEGATQRGRIVPVF